MITLESSFRALGGALSRLDCACNIGKTGDAVLPKLDDVEDFQRAIRRGDVLFFHSTLELALDAFLQTLFSLHRVYFPSRKRFLERLASFRIKPRDCEERLLRVAEISSNSDALSYAHEVWQRLCAELLELLEANRV